MTPAPPRLPALDQLRGWVIVIMALDHTGDFFSGLPFDPLDLSRTTPALFLTRWITHLCAPVFVLLAGAGAFLYGARGRTRAQLSGFLLLRGLLLIALEHTLVRFGWFFGQQPGFFLAQVIWALGWSLVALAGLVWLPLSLVGAFGALLIAGHNTLDGFSAAQLGLPTWLWTVLHEPGLLRLGPSAELFVLYPLVPWVGVMALGYALGPLLLWPAPRQRRAFLALGLALSIAFLLLRAINLYGDPLPWRPQASALLTALAFVNTEKYPPSLLFLLMTLGPALMILAALDRPPGRLGRFLAVYGRVPLFFYLLHLPLIHALDRLAGPSRPHDLPLVYAVWLLVVAALYLPCRAYAALKQRRSAGWWSLF
jgi:uncharacterized membrane protein